jgi:hypothetical protein
MTVEESAATIMSDLPVLTDIPLRDLRVYAGKEGEAAKRRLLADVGNLARSVSGGGDGTGGAGSWTI